jgi:hypothetical protein
MTRNILEIAFDDAAGVIEPECPGCGAPNPDADGVLLLGTGERIEHCELCDHIVDWRGRSAVRMESWGPTTTIVFTEPDPEKLAAIRSSGRPWSPLPDPVMPT